MLQAKDMGKLLLVDDDVTFTSKLKEAMARLGWSVELAHNGLDALQLLSSFQYDFVLLDWNLPDFSGVDICKRFRDSGGTADVIFLTARSSVEDKVFGFNSGGDDYLTKPFDARELLARMSALRRRHTSKRKGTHLVGDVQFDPQLRTVSRADDQITLSPIECSLLEHLCKNPDTYFSSSALFEAVWTSEAQSSENTVRTHMMVLRRKLGTITSQEIVRTVRRAGYYIASEDLKI
jgi:DNA-binding response OmpR family regulator